MNHTYFHLLINQLPIYGTFFGAIVMTAGLFTKSYQTKIAAYVVYLISAIGAVLIYFTGPEVAKTAMETQATASVAFEQYLQYTFYTIATIGFLGLCSIGGLYLTFNKSRMTRMVALLILYLSIVGFGLAIKSSYEGELIRHNEMNNATGISTEMTSSSATQGM